MNHLGLFEGGGIPSLALKYTIPDLVTIGYNDFDKYCCQIIEARIRDGILDDAPIFHCDIREFNRTVAPLYAGKVDIITAGFPCQPFSVAGKKLGENDARNQWPATRDCLSIIQPRFALLENVPGLLAHEYTRRIFGELAEIGYDCEWYIASATGVGAPHLRKRVWILANSRHRTRRDNISGNVELCSGKQNDSPIGHSPHIKATGPSSESETMADTIGLRELQPEGCITDKRGRVGDGSWWGVEPDVGRVAHGVANRVDRIRTCGNGWVFHVVASILRYNTEDGRMNHGR